LRVSLRRGPRRPPGGLALAALVASALAIGGSALGSTTSASITLKPDSVPQGGKTRVVGKGFVSGESVTISLDAKTRATTTAAPDGTFR
jgi:hypothetical protein